MEISKKISKEKPRRYLWKNVDVEKYQRHVIIGSTIESEDTNERIVYMKDLEKRKQVYGICGECNEPGTGGRWCQPCNAKRFKDNFKNWTSGNKDIDKFIQQSQLDAVYCEKYLEWIPFENFKDVTYITKGGFSKIYSAIWPEGYIWYWDIENQKWWRQSNEKVVLKCLDNSSDMSKEFLNEVNSHLQIHLLDVIKCHGISKDPVTKNYMFVLEYCNNGNLRNYLNNYENYVDYKSKIQAFFEIARGLLDIHNAGKVHKYLHSGNILFDSNLLYISDLGMCQPANVNNDKKEENLCGVLPYLAPEVLRGYQYTKASDIYSFGIIMNEFISEESPYNDIPHDHVLAVKICKGMRPKLSQETPKLLVDLIMKCWDANPENRPTAKELYQILNKWNKEWNENSEIYSKIKEYDKLSKEKFKNRLSKRTSNDIQTHPQAIYTSRFLNFKNLPEPVNSSDLSSFYSDSIQSTSANPISECLDVQLSELDLIEIDQEENDIDE
ncbi:kinase-like domain-containing protein [Glomus cerebriforme]|uniref:Kinase-like domain-containing protein n=1 Tax=Glomus cerebriforme TaxID=658196 RepID=A0A397SLC7_9GLOM|nr:kinase-like domain-containing protein [Glomus cerebriforme]